MAKTLANYDPLVQIPSGMTPAGADFPIVESHDILVGENDKRLDAKLDDIDSAIGNVGQTPIATQLSSKVNTGDIVTSVAATGSTSNNKIPSETAVRAAIEAKTINVDSTVTQGSTNAVSGGAVHTQLATKQDTLTFDTTPTASSSNPVTSGGVKSALDTKQDALTFDTTPTASSSNPVTSGGVKAALDTKQNTLTYETTPIVGSVNPVTSTGIRNAIDTAAAQNLGAMQAQYAEFVADADAVLDRASSLSNGMVACSNIDAETTVGDTRILLYTGTTNSKYTNGHWYYNSAASNAAPSWTDGGVVGSAPTIDNTLAIDGAAANSKSVGDAIENIVTISNTQPGSNSGNKVWIRETTNEEVQVPTYAEHIAKANKADIATNNESDNGSGTISASKAYAIGDHFYINNTNTSSENYGVSTLYKATAAIASGAAIVVGTNCEASKVADEITSLSNDIDTVKADLDELNGTLYLSIDESEFINRKYIWSDGKIYNNNSYTLSPYIRCAFKKIKFNCLTSGGGIQCVAFYSEENEASFIGGYENTISLSTLPEHEMDVPDGANYIRISKNAAGAYTATVKPWVMSADSAESVAERIDVVEKTADEAMYKADNIDASDILSDVYHLVYSDTNLIPSDGMLEHSYVDDTGTIKTTTNQSAGTYEFVLSGYIPVENGKTLYLSGDDFFYNRYFAWYDVNKNYIGGNSLSGGMAFTAHVASVMVPNNAAYLQITFRTAENAAVAWAGYTGTAPTGEVINATNAEYLDYHYYPENPCDFIGRDICVFNKILCIGDSITAGYINHSGGGQTIAKYSYPAHLQKITGVECINMGDSGETSVSWWEIYQNEDFSSYDCAIINLGINDVLFSVSEADTRSSFTNIIGALKSASTGIKIFIANINPAYSRGNTTYDAINAIIEDIATSTENCYFIDLTRYGHAVGAAYANGHLTAVGYWMLAEDYANAISYIIRNNPVAFRFVQFIGTDLHN